MKNTFANSSLTFSKRVLEELRNKLDSNVDAIEHLASALKSVQTLVNDQIKKEQMRKRSEQLKKRIQQQGSSFMGHQNHSNMQNKGQTASGSGHDFGMNSRYSFDRD